MFFGINITIIIIANFVRFNFLGLLEHIISSNQIDPWICSLAFVKSCSYYCLFICLKPRQWLIIIIYKILELWQLIQKFKILLIVNFFSQFLRHKFLLYNERAALLIALKTFYDILFELLWEFNLTEFLFKKEYERVETLS